MIPADATIAESVAAIDERERDILAFLDKPAGCGYTRARLDAEMGFSTAPAVAEMERKGLIIRRRIGGSKLAEITPGGRYALETGETR